MRVSAIKVAAVGLGLATCLAAPVAIAGYVYSLPVTVYSGSSGEFWGTFSGARYSSDDNQQIGCYVTYSTGSPYTYCWADNAADTYASCGTTDPNVAALLGRLNDSAYLYVAYNSSGCTEIEVGNSSIYIH
jgi:hypothetical protein